MTKNAAVSKLLAWAAAQVGYTEGTNNYNKYAQDTRLQQLYGWNAQNQPWCDLFTDEGFIECFGLEKGAAMTYQRIGGGSAACRYSAQFFKDNGAFVTVPEPGDVIFFYSDGAINHQGLVEHVGIGAVTTIEGNSSDRVMRHTYSMSDSYIAGYGRPKWSVVADESSAQPEGIDISNWQRGINVAALQTDFLICKLCEGADWIDPCFDEFYSAAKVPVGAYVYSHATTEAAAVAEAKKALYLLKGRKLPLGVYMDVEEGAQLALSDSALTAVVKAFCDTIRAGGYRPGAYGSTGNLWAKVGASYLGEDVLVWAASWGAEPRIKCDVWQYTDHASAGGMNVDGNRAMSERFTALVNGDGGEEVPVPPEEDEKEPVSPEKDFSLDFRLLRHGDTGEDVKAAQMLLIARGCSCGWYGADGDFGNATLAAVKKYQAARGLEADGIVGAQTLGALLGR